MATMVRSKSKPKRPKPKRPKLKRPKLGRPFREGVPTASILTIRLTAAERSSFERAAGDQSVSEWARNVLARAARRAS